MAACGLMKSKSSETTVSKIGENMSKSKSISDLVLQLQKENESLTKLKKSFNKICKDEFGYCIDDLHKIVEMHNDYEQRRAEKQGREQTVERSETV